MSAMAFSCKKDSGTNIPVISISDTGQTVNENIGTVTMTINLDRTASQDIKLSNTITGTAILNGDFEVDSASQITIPAGSKTASLKFKIYDDPIVESDKTIHIKFSSAANVSFTNSEATITIKDNDVSKATDGLQTDLYWDAGTSVNLDLYAANNVTINNDTVTNYNLVDNSKNAKGFESVLIKNIYADGKYYLVVAYESGSRSVNFTLNSNGPGVTNSKTDGSLSSSDVGYAYFYGPITKSGSSYSRLSGSIFNLGEIKPHILKGMIKE
jgi:hypothetical protein